VKFKIIKEILQSLATAYKSDIDLSLEDIIYHPYKLLYGDLKKYYRADSINHALKRAEKKGWVRKLINNEKVYVSLSELGRQELNKFKEKAESPLLPQLKKSNKAWDGKYRVVFFDIPEENRIIRDTLRSKLKEFGFVGWQKSVWLTRENITRTLRNFLRDNGLEDYILIIETKDLGNNTLEGLLNREENKN